MQWTSSAGPVSLDSDDDAGSEVVGLGRYEDAVGGFHHTQIIFWVDGPRGGGLGTSVCVLLPILIQTIGPCGGYLCRAAEGVEGILPTATTIPHRVAKVWSLNGIGSYVRGTEKNAYHRHPEK